MQRPFTSRSVAIQNGAGVKNAGFRTHIFITQNRQYGILLLENHRNPRIPRMPKIFDFRARQNIVTACKPTVALFQLNVLKEKEPRTLNYFIFVWNEN